MKGSHISLMIELLAGAMTGAHMSEGKGPARRWGSTVIAVDPAVFGSLEEFQANANLMCERVKNAKILPNHAEGDKKLHQKSTFEDLWEHFLRHS